MIEFFNARMQEAKLNTAPGNPVIAAQINLEQNFAFIEVCVWQCVLVVISLMMSPFLERVHCTIPWYYLDLPS